MCICVHACVVVYTPGHLLFMCNTTRTNALTNTYRMCTCVCHVIEAYCLINRNEKQRDGEVLLLRSVTNTIVFCYLFVFSLSDFEIIEIFFMTTIEFLAAWLYGYYPTKWLNGHQQLHLVCKCVFSDITV